MSSKGAINPHHQAVSHLQNRIKVARGDAPADFVIRGAAWLDVFSGQWQTGDVAVFDGVIVGTAESYDGNQVIDGHGAFLVPGFIDAHVHVESSMMTPFNFAKTVFPKGTTTVIWDPHEIANVKGLEGIDWALAQSEGLMVDFMIMIPSCVPSTSSDLELETSGAELKPADLKKYQNHPRVIGLAEMMNWPGLIAGDQDVLEKLALFQFKRRDGHCPGLHGRQLNAYGVAGIHSCHESTTLAEAREKLKKGIHVLVREGSCARDGDALLPILTPWSSSAIGLCSDDRNPLDIEDFGHLDFLINKGLITGLDPVAIFRAASYAPALMYGLADRGAIAPGYRADLVLVTLRDSKAGFGRGVDVKTVWQQGRTLEHFNASRSHPHRSMSFSGPNLKIKSEMITANDFAIRTASKLTTSAHVIGMQAGVIVTEHLIRELTVAEGVVQANIESGINKIAVIERHHKTGRMASAFVHGFDLKSGAIATSINHDCHNVIVVGSSDELMAQAVARLRHCDGGIVVVSQSGDNECLPLKIGGLMTDDDPGEIAQALRRLKRLAKEIGCPLEEPFLQLSFLALPVIPALKITDRGLVDGTTFKILSR